MADDIRRKRKRELTRLRVERFRRNKKELKENEKIVTLQINPSTSADVYHDNDVMDPPYNDIFASLELETSEVGIAVTDKNLLNNIDQDLLGDEECNETFDYDEINNGDEWFDQEASGDEDDFDVDANEEYDEVEQLKIWAASSKLSHTSIEGMLNILRKRIFPQLPLSAKTFLKTCSIKYDIEAIDNTSQFVYFGLSDTLQRQVNTSLHYDNKIELLLNFDGLPLFKSSAKQFWPILCLVFHQSSAYKPFPVAIFAGDKKPNNLVHYLRKLVDELNNLQRNGLTIENIAMKISVKAIICDRPARSLIKCIKNHGAYYACERCIVKGDRTENRTVYLQVHSELRTHDSFCNQKNVSHHVGRSPLLHLDNCDMINMFVLDFMHLCYLGNMKKLLVDYWLNSKSHAKLSFAARRSLSAQLTSLKSQVPEDFQRTTRDLGEISKWKATEFRFFLLYTGPVVLKSYLSERKYNHFLLLHTACRILSSDEFAVTCNSHAKLFLLAYVLDAAQLYGQKNNVLNVHYLIHLADDAKYLQSSLSYFTAFPFENLLGQIKSLLRSGNRPLAQVCRRLSEISFTYQEKVQLPLEIEILSKNNAREGDKIIIKKLRYRKAILALNNANNTVLIDNGDVMQITKMYTLSNRNEIKVLGKMFRKEKPLFRYPCSSEFLCMWEVSKTEIEKKITLTSILRKMVTFIIEEKASKKIYVLPLLHC